MVQIMFFDLKKKKRLLRGAHAGLFEQREFTQEEEQAHRTFIAAGYLDNSLGDFFLFPKRWFIRSDAQHWGDLSL